MIKILLMYSTLGVSTFFTGWVTGDFIYSILVPLVITAVTYTLYDLWLENGMKKRLTATTASLGINCRPNEHTEN